MSISRETHFLNFFSIFRHLGILEIADTRKQSCTRFFHLNIKVFFSTKAVLVNYNWTADETLVLFVIFAGFANNDTHQFSRTLNIMYKNKVV